MNDENEDVTDEQAVIGLALHGVTDGVRMLDPDDYINEHHRTIAASVLALAALDAPINNITVADHLERAGHLKRLGGRGRLHDLMTIGSDYVGPSATWYANEVRVRARVRRLAIGAQKLGNLARGETAGEYIDDIVRKFRDDLDNLPPELGGDPDAGWQHTAKHIRSLPDRPETWIVPGLIARGDRVMVTGVEGYGKSQFLYQLSACVAAGLNPFSGARVADGMRVMGIDCENPERRVQGGVKFLASRVERNYSHAAGWDERWTVRRYPAGLNLLAARDVNMLLEIAERETPDLIVIGPIYKLMRGDPNKDADMLGVLAALDDLRVRSDAALVIEAHSGHAQNGQARPVRPFGSSVQLRWPEIGFGIRPDERPELAGERMQFSARFNNRVTHMECVAWRGQREDRDWPTHIRYGDAAQLPWVPTDDRWRPSVDTGYRVQPELGVRGER